MRRFDHACGFPTCTGKRRNGALQAYAEFGRVTSGFDHTVVAVGHIEHYGQQKLVVKLGDGILYHAGESLEQQKEQLKNGCNIIINKVRVNNSTKRKFAICKIVQRGDWAGVVDYEKVPLSPANKKRNAVSRNGCQIRGTQGSKT